MKGYDDLEQPLDSSSLHAIKFVLYVTKVID